MGGRENRLLFSHAKLIARVRKKWMSREAPSVTDQGRWDREFLSHYPNAPAAAYIQRSAMTQSFFHSDHGGWLHWFAMDRVHVPLEQVDMHLFECGISVSHRTDMVAILQEVLEAAGYVFRNLVPLWMVSEPSRSVDHATVSKFATDGMSLLQAEIVEWRRYVTAMRHTPQGQAFDAARAEFEAARTRPRPTFSISSLSGDGSMHDVEGPLFDLSVSDEEYADEAEATPDVARPLNFDDVSPDSHRQPRSSGPTSRAAPTPHAGATSRAGAASRARARSARTAPAQAYTTPETGGTHRASARAAARAEGWPPQDVRGEVDDSDVDDEGYTLSLTHI